MTQSSVHAIEVTSRCQLACPYCPHPKAMTRPKIDMTDEIFTAALRWVDPSVMPEVNLSGVGEPLMHPHIVQYVAQTRMTFGPNMVITIPTNGLLLDEEMGARLAPFRPAIFVSMHVPAKAAHAVHVAMKYGMLVCTSFDPVERPNNVAGQVDWYTSPATYPCPWIQRQQTFVSAEGYIYACCFNVTGESPLAHVSETPRQLEVKPWRVCPQCHNTTSGE